MRISGLASGMDTEQMIKDIMTAQRIPVDKVFQQKVKAEWKRDAYRDVNTKLLRFRNMAFDMTLQGTYQKNGATSSHKDILTVTATGKSQPGNYEIKVEELAESAKFISKSNVTFDVKIDPNDPDSQVERLTSFEIQGLDSKMETISIGANDTLGDVVAKINANKNLGISAFYNGDQVSFRTTATGEKTGFVVDENFTKIFGGNIDGEIDGGYGVLKDQSGAITGKDAVLKVNDLDLKQSSNTFDLNGVTVNLHEAKKGTTVKVEVRQDVDAVVDKIKEFVNLYNELVDEFNLSTREETFRDFKPLTAQERSGLSDKEIEQWEAKAKSGLLRSDPILGSVLSEMRMALGAAVQGLEGNKTLSQIGIKTGSWYEYGKLHIDEEKLRSAVEEDPEGIRDMFTQQSEVAGEKGLARRLTSVLDNSMKRLTDTAGKASISYDQSFLGEQIRDYESRLGAMEERLIRYEQSQWDKFTAMERMLGQLNSQSDWLYQQLMTMQG